MSEIAIEMRAAIIALGGERSWSETRQRWLEKAARGAGISYRSAKALFYCEDREPRASTVEMVRRAVAARAKAEADDRADTRDIIDRIAFLEQRLATLDPDFFEPASEALRAASHLSRPSQDRPGTEGRAVDRGVSEC